MCLLSHYFRMDMKSKFKYKSNAMPLLPSPSFCHKKKNIVELLLVLVLFFTGSRTLTRATPEGKVTFVFTGGVEAWGKGGEPLWTNSNTMGRKSFCVRMPESLDKVF